jgi:hypothetical protein
VLPTTGAEIEGCHTPGLLLYLCLVGAGEHGALQAVLATCAMLVALPLAGCDLPPCESLNLRSAQTRGLDQPASDTTPGDSIASVLAISETGNIEILRECDSKSQCEQRKLSLPNPPDGVGKAQQLMLTASGRWLVYQGKPDTPVMRLDLDTCTGSSCIGIWEAVAPDIDHLEELVGTLRGGDWIIYRDTSNQLRALYVGEDPIFQGGPESALGKAFALGSGFDLRVVALGHRHVVARQSRGDGIEELYLIRVAPAYKVDEFGTSTIGQALLLATGPAFQRVLITEGPSPAERGHPNEFQHDIPTDVQVIATSGEGPDARTLIYDVSNLDQIANFAGEVVTKHAVLEDVAGLGALSPDGTHLAYLTSDGGLALRNLASQRSCLIKSSDSATHVLAGFAADATLYFEAEEDAYLDDDHTGYERRDVENIYTYDALAQTFTALTTPQTFPDTAVWRLKAVPPGADTNGQPWAVANGEFLVKPGVTAKSLNYDEAQFLPRSNADGDLWVIEAETENGFNVHRLNPDGQEVELQDRPTQSDVCVSSAPSAGWTAPWATRCSSASKPEEYLDNGLPEPEQGP